MTDFCLWKPKTKALPDTVEVDGRAFKINPGFRVALKILAIMADPEIISGHKNELVCKYFFKDEVPTGWDAALDWFLKCGDTEPQETSNERTFDYSFDAPEIYASFMNLYGIDLFEVNLHWWQFSALLSGCFRCECPLSEKIRVRTIDPEKCEDKPKARRAKRAAQIPTTVSEDEKITSEAIMERLKAGKPINDLIKGG